MNSKQQILEMVKDGVLSVEEGVKLLEAMGNTEEVRSKAMVKSNNAKMFRVIVDSPTGEKVRVNIPMSLIKVGANVASNIKVDGKPVDMHGVDIEQIIQMVEEGAIGELVTVEGENGETVRVFVD